MESWQEEDLGYGQITFKFILYLHANGLMYNHNKIYDFMSRYEKYIQLNMCIFICVCRLYPVALDSNSHIVSFIHCYYHKISSFVLVYSYLSFEMESYSLAEAALELTMHRSLNLRQFYLSLLLLSQPSSGHMGVGNGSQAQWQVILLPESPHWPSLIGQTSWAVRAWILLPLPPRCWNCKPAPNLSFPGSSGI